ELHAREYRDHDRPGPGERFDLRSDLAEKLRLDPKHDRIERAVRRNGVELVDAFRNRAIRGIGDGEARRRHAARNPALQHGAGHVAASDEENVLESIHAASAQSSVIFAAPAYASGHCSEFASTSCFLKTNSEARVIFRK